MKFTFLINKESIFKDTPKNKTLIYKSPTKYLHAKLLKEKKI
jgi:hypothetical protein